MDDAMALTSLLFRGRIFTGDPDAPWAEAMAVRDGLIAHVGGLAAAAGDATGDSATIIDIIEPLAAMLGLDGAIGSELEVAAGVLTGEIAEHCHGEHKAARLTAFAAQHGIDLSISSAYSDSISDEPFLRAVGRPWCCTTSLGWH